MPLDVSPTATADIRMGVGPAGRAPETVMQVRARSLGSHSDPISRSRSDSTTGRKNKQRASAARTEPTTRRAGILGLSRRLVDGRCVLARERLRRGRPTRDARDSENRARARDRRIRETRKSRDRDSPILPPRASQVFKKCSEHKLANTLALKGVCRAHPIAPPPRVARASPHLVADRRLRAPAACPSPLGPEDEPVSRSFPSRR